MDTQEYFTPGEVARQLRVHRDTVMRWIRTGILESEVIHEGRRVRHHIKASTLEAIEQRGKHQALV